MKNTSFDENISFFVPPFELAGLDKSTPVLIALSGGRDSAMLLDLLYEDSKKNGYTLHVAHFNHGIRGDEADRDEQFCKTLAKKYSLPFHSCFVDIPYHALQSGNSLEAEGRRRRYQFFEMVMRENGIPILATAHHAKDNLETILLHMIRGSGVNGLTGIAPHRAFADNMHLVRPILRAEESDIDAYCRRNSIEFVEDSTNSDTVYLRNAIRHKVVEPLCEIEPGIYATATRVSEILTEENGFIDSMALDFIHRECNNGSSPPLESFNALHKALKSRVLSTIFANEFEATLERVHILALIELCEKAKPHSSISLPAGIKGTIENGKLVFAKEKKEIITSSLPLPLAEGEIRINDSFSLKIVQNPQYDEGECLDSIEIPSRLVEGENAYFRSKEDGDTILHKKLNKKIKKLFNEKATPLAFRRDLPLLVLDGEVLWIPTVAVCDRLKACRINKERESFYRISIRIENK